MAIHPAHQAIKTLFEQNNTFEVPRYQRGYAWEEEAISDFIDDIKRSLENRLASKAGDHFFGGIVATTKPVAGSTRSNHEIIDGQQRLASFVMLAAVLVQTMTEITEELAVNATPPEEEQKASAFLTETISHLRGLYLTFKEESNLEYKEIPKLTLSQADNSVFQSLLAGIEATPERDSHRRLIEAWQRLTKFISVDLLGSLTSVDKAKTLRCLVHDVLAKACTAIFMRADSKTEAYRIFQVLNDRGVSLTDGDLLRARTLELLDSASLFAIQEEVASYWDRALAYPPPQIASYLQWYFSSYEGNRPRPAVLIDQYLEARFKQKEKAQVAEPEAKKILAETKQIDRDFDQLSILGQGQWPFPKAKAKSWDRERLRMLVLHLEHTNAMPLLLSLLTLDEDAFSTAVAAIERFVFRYKTVGNVHIGKMTAMYLKHAKQIRTVPKYSVKTLKSDLKQLALEAVPDAVFEAKLRELHYAPRGGNGSIRYLLITLEDHLKWFNKGAQGEPKCLDKMRVFDLTGTTLEHVYPVSAAVKDKDAALEKVKHTLGNLTVLTADENDKLANKAVGDKQSALATSSLHLNRSIATAGEWTKDRVEERTNQLVAMALKVFVP